MPRALIGRVLATLVLVFALLGGGGVGAQSVRDLLPLGEAAPKRSAEASPQGSLAERYVAASALDATQRELDRFRARLVATLSSASRLPEEVGATLARASPSGRPSFFAGLAAFLVFLIVIGRGAGVLFGVYVARPIFVGMQRLRPQGLLEKAPVLATRIGLVLAGLAVTLLVAALAGAGFYPDDEPAAVSSAIVAFTGYAAVRLGDTIWRMVLAPYLPDYRVPALGDREALRLYRWMFAVLLTVVGLGWALYWLAALGLERESHTLLLVIALALEASVAIAAAAVNRRAVSRAILGGEAPETASWLARGAARLWLPALILFLVLASAEAAYRAVMGAPAALAPAKTLYIVLTGGLLLYGFLLYLIERAARRRSGAEAPPAAPEAPDVPPPPGDPTVAEAETDADEEGGGGARAAPVPPPEGGLDSYAALARRIAGLFSVAVGLYALIRLWFGSDVLGEGATLDLARGVLEIAFVGYVAYHAVRIWMDRRIAEEGGPELDLEPGDEGGGASAASRVATLLPLVRSLILGLIAASAAIFVLIELGVNVAPLLGGAGVVGLALGFGSQTLVRDILSGAFFLFDDAFRKGEYVDIGEVKGTVEKISLRSFQLRHHLGALNTIPFGEIRYLTNYSRDWVMMKLPLRLTYDTDVETVRKLVKKLGQELLQHPEEGHKFLQPLKSQGVYQMEDSAMIVRVKFMTRPGDQWTTRKLVYQKIRELFEREGIRFAHREVTVRIPDLPRDRPLTENERRAAGAAARRAVDAAEEEQVRPMAVGDER